MDVLAAAVVEKVESNFDREALEGGGEEKGV